MEKIYPLIDTYSAIFENFSFIDIFDYLELDKDFINEYLYENSFYDRTSGYYDNAVIRKFGIELSIDKLYFCNCDYIDYNDFIELKIPKVRLHIFGDGLQYLRGEGIKIDNILFHKPTLQVGQDFHVTRVDIAYDFIDYKLDFFHKMYTYLMQLQINNLKEFNSNRLCIINKGGGSTFSLKSGSKENTIYIGSSASDKILRIYDKKLEWNNKHIGVDIPYDIDNSWYRIEWQLRNDYANNILFDSYNNDRFTDILDIIINEYIFKDYEKSKKNVEVPVDWWLDIFDKGYIHHIIQNAKCVSMVSVLDRVKKGTQNSNKNTLLYIDMYGLRGYLKNIIDFVEFLNKENNDDFIEYKRRKQLKRFLVSRAELDEFCKKGYVLFKNGGFELSQKFFDIYKFICDYELRND